MPRRAISLVRRHATMAICHYKFQGIKAILISIDVICAGITSRRIVTSIFRCRIRLITSTINRARTTTYVNSGRQVRLFNLIVSNFHRMLLINFLASFRRRTIILGIMASRATRFIRNGLVR